MTVRKTCLAVSCAARFAAHAAASFAQASLTLAGDAHDKSLPIEISANRLSVENETSRTVFEGSAVVVQGDLRLAAEKIVAIYDEALGNIKTVSAENGVNFSNGKETASADFGDYSVQDGILVLRGNVALNQGPNVIQGDMLTLDLNAGTAVVEGNVTTVLHTNSGG